MTATESPLTSIRPRWSADAWTVPLVSLVAACVAASSNYFTDPLWMAREGVALLHGGPVAHPDTWGWDPVAGNFIPTAPGWQVFLGLWTLAFGPVGVTIGGIIAVALSLAGLAWVARRCGASSTAIAVAFLWLWAVQGALASRAALPALALWMVDGTWLLAWLRQATSQLPSRQRLIRSAVTQAAITTLGLWIHASWALFAPATAFGIALWALLPQPGPRSLRLRLALWPMIATLLAISAGPAGLNAWSDAARVQAQCAGLIVEWSPFPAQSTFWQVALIVIGSVLALIAGVSLRRAPAWHETPIVALSLATIASTGAAFFALRFMFQAVVLAAPLLAALITRLWTKMGRTRPADHRLGPLYLGRLLAFTFAVLLPWAGLQVRTSPAVAPSPVVAALPSGCHLFADYAIANEVLLLRPDVPVWFDGRLDYWGRQRITSYIRYMAGSNPTGPVPSGTTCVAATASESALASSLSASHRWREARRLRDVSLWLPAST